MDEPLHTAVAWEPNVAENALVEETSLPYVGRWNRLVSMTNWQKGRIIAAWREALVEAAGPPGSYSDDAWSRRVGGVSPQHVGRLRRVYQRFGNVRKQYPGLYWSHFQAALEWPDAEMWLEGAVQNRWSIADMRQQRWQAIGAPAELKPCEDDVVQGELDEDADCSVDSPVEAMTTAALSETVGVVQQAEPAAAYDAADCPLAETSSPPPAPFENLANLPTDLSEALEELKLVILRHKLAGWQEVSRSDVLAVLDGLKQLALAMAE